MNSSHSAGAHLYRNPIWKRISAWAQESPERVCIRTTTGATVQYQDLIRRVDATALELVRRGFKPGDRAFFLARPTINSIVYFLAVMRAGGVIIAADTAMGRASFRSRMRLVDPAWIITEPILWTIGRLPFARYLARLAHIEIPDLDDTGHAQTILVERHPSMRLAHTHQESETPDAHDALIVFTSGTTAEPKAVVHTYASIVATLDLITQDLSPSREDVFYASQLYFLFIALLTGATAVLPPHRAFNARTFVHHLELFNVTKAYALPAECEALIDLLHRTARTLPTSLTSLMLGSAPILAGFLRRLSTVTAPTTQVLCIYGSTEILPISRVTMREKLAFQDQGDLLGLPFSGINVRIEDTEIIVSGANLCRGYFGSDPMHEHRTGDLGTIDALGRIVLMGRKKDMIIRGNYNIYPALFESIIEHIEGVRHCALIGIYQTQRSDEEIVLVVEKEDGISDTALRSRLERELLSGPNSIDTYAHPDRIVCMKLPQSGRSHKVDKAALRALLTQI